MSRLTGPQRAIVAINGCTRLEPKLRHALLAMVQWIDWDNFTLRPSIASLQSALGVSRNTTMKRLEELETAGAVAIVRGGGGRGSTHRITIDIDWLEGGQPALFGKQPTAQPTAQKADKKHPPQDCTLIEQKGSNSDALMVQKSKIRVQPWGGPEQQEQSETQPPPPRARARGAESGDMPGGGRGGGWVQSDGTKAPPVAPTVRRVAEVEPKPIHEANQAGKRDTTAINAKSADPVVEALVALTVPRAVAQELAALPHTDLGLVAYVAAAAELQKPHRPARWIASLVRGGPERLEGWDQHLAKQRDRERRLCTSLIAKASHWAHEHASDEVYRPFIVSAVAAVKAQFPSGWAEAARDGSLHPSVIRPDATPVEVLASLAASCGVDLEIPTDTLRMPERDERGPTRDGASHAV